MAILLEDTPSIGSNPNQRLDAPQIGMEFTDDDKAYKFYNEYARNIGFGVRKNQIRKNSKMLSYIEASLAIERVIIDKKPHFSSQNIRN